MNMLSATVRLQLHRGFNFDDAAAAIDYYARLGISHFYVSPIFASSKGSTHGYDVVDPTRINPELGGEDGLQRLVGQLRAAGMGLVIDIVPNHMGVAPGTNGYWQSVLQWGRRSPYAQWFDIDWESSAPHLNGKLLLPVLGDTRDAVLLAGDLQLKLDEASGRLELAYHDSLFPLSPASVAEVFGTQKLLAGHAEAFLRAQPDTIEAACLSLAKSIHEPDGRSAAQAALLLYAPGSVQGRARLQALLDRQHYRLSWWRNAAEEINWRRFFEVSDLAGVRVELDAVFEATHALVLDLYRRGLIDGVRIDHVDGLANPAAYCRRLRERLDTLHSGRPAPLNRGRAWIIVEKILTPGEALAADWRVDGTTGYDFMDQVGELLHDGTGETAIRSVWKELAADPASFEIHVQQAREQLLQENVVGELHALVHALHCYAALATPPCGDIAWPAILRVTTALLAAFRRYRCYSTSSGLSEEDRRVLQKVASDAQKSLRLPDHELLNRVVGWLGLDTGLDDGDAARHLRERAITRFQQLTPPLAAKSVEDTTFYRHAPLLSRNDVGSFPLEPAGGAAVFHEANCRRLETFPHALLATATHDHKRGEDVRARLAVLSEIPDIWADHLRRWTSSHKRLKSVVPGAGGVPTSAPLPADEIMLYQTLLGAWPAGLQPEDAGGVSKFAERVAAWQQKSLREAKQLSSWMLPNEPYETACGDFLQSLLAGEVRISFLKDLLGLLEKIRPAAEANSLTQTLLRLTSPGVPDLYQGCEFEDLSLVDPDNRRPVDMAARLIALDQPPQQNRKQHLIRAVLNYRQQNQALFEQGDYLPLEVLGDRQHHVVAFARRVGEQIAVIAAIRLPFTLVGGPASSPQRWGDTKILLPPGFPANSASSAHSAKWRDVISSQEIVAADNKMMLAGMFDAQTVALWVPNVS
jgi:(1->4)-alpha-D-glucan 1-alpha-D-glucosylmutase